MFNDIKILKINRFSDNRGYLWTVWRKKIFKNLKFNHDKVSVSKKILLEDFIVTSSPGN